MAIAKKPASKKVAAPKKATAPVKRAPATKASAAKPAGRATAAPAPVPAPKADKPRKPKLVRDSFTIPKAEYAVLDTLKQRAARLAHPAKKSELLRAGIKALAAMSDADLSGALAQVPAIKTGRPTKA